MTRSDDCDYDDYVNDGYDDDLLLTVHSESDGGAGPLALLLHAIRGAAPVDPALAPAHPG